MSHLDQRLDDLLSQRKGKGRFRQLREYDTSQESALVDFSSNDYLSMTTSERLRSAYLAKLASTTNILGSTGSRLLSGSTSSHSSLEARFSAFFHSPAALLFNSGWDANVSFFATVPQPGDFVVYDELVHASVHSGMRASRIPLQSRIPFKHNDANFLEKVLSEVTNANVQGSSSNRSPIVYLALESLYSMDGDMAPLPRLLDVFDKFVPRQSQCVVVDEAHSTGLYGRQGRGVTHALGEEGGWGDAGTERGKGRVTVRLMTFGKGVGGSGAVLLSSATIRSFLINFARPLIFSTALPHSTLVALECAWDVLQSSEGERRRASLHSVITHLNTLLDPLLAQTSPNILRLPEQIPHDPFPVGVDQLLPYPPTPILGLITPEPHALSKYFLDRGFIVRPVVPPTVPVGEERVRICLRAGMERPVIDRLVSILREWVAEKQAMSRQGGGGVGAALASGHVSARAKL